MHVSKNKFTVKIILSYLLLIILAITASFYIYSEIEDYLSTESTEENDIKLLKTSTFLTKLYEAESLSKLALQSQKKKNFLAYSAKIDSIYHDIGALKKLSESNYQTGLLDSLSFLLERKVANNNALRKLKAKNQTSRSISNALNEFDKMEASLGIITAESLAPNLIELSPKAQETLRRVARYLNENIPSEETEIDRAKKVDSILQVSRALLKEVEEDNLTNENFVANQELKINRTDLELTQQLRNIISSLEKEVLVSSINDNINREAALKRSIHLAGIAAILGFLVVGVFTFIINRDFWKANLYRQKLEKEKKFSESLLKSREQLITTVSHDLRTPLNTITGYAEIIEKSGLTEKQTQYFDHIKSAASYVNNLVNDLLDFSRLEAGKINIEKVPFNLSHLLAETAEDITAQYKHKGLSLVLDIDGDLEQHIIGDPFRLRQIMTNLLSNAFKFTHEGSITIEARRMQNQTMDNLIQIGFKDTGIGISKEKQQLIFKEFTQAEKNTEKNYGGYGLGLTISKKLVALLGGKLELESTVGSGSTFTMTLPVEFTTNLALDTLSQKESLGKQPRILILDDDVSFIQMVGEMLRSENLEPILCTDFNDLGKTELTYDVVLTDIEMPNITGFEVLTNLKSGEYGHYTNQPIIAMTGRRDIKEHLFLSHGFHTVLQKPFTKTKLLKTLHSLQIGNKNVPKTSSPSPLDEEVQDSPYYSLKILRSFLGDDEKSLNELLGTFITDTHKNMKQLKIAVVQGDYATTQKVAHRMLPMFKQLKIRSCVHFLESLETANEGSANLEETYKNIQNSVDMVLEELNKHRVKHPNYTD